jgi:hypothetical protein
VLNILAVVSPFQHPPELTWSLPVLLLSKTSSTFCL